MVVRAAGEQQEKQMALQAACHHLLRTLTAREDLGGAMQQQSLLQLMWEKAGHRLALLEVRPLHHRLLVVEARLTLQPGEGAVLKRMGALDATSCETLTPPSGDDLLSRAALLVKEIHRQGLL